MIACFAWTNLQMINISNAKVNLYSDEQADLFVRMGPHISAALVEAVRNSGIYKNVYTFDPVVLSYKNMRWGWVPGFKVFLLKGAFQEAYSKLLQDLCGTRKYSRVLITWFYAENVFAVDYWMRNTDKLAITLVEEGTGSYFYKKKDLFFPMFMGKHMKDRIRRKITEYPLAKKLSKCIDTICLYQPQCCQPDVDYIRLALPQVTESANPRIHHLLCAATPADSIPQKSKYDNSDAIYFSPFSQEGLAYDAVSQDVLLWTADLLAPRSIVAKLHTGCPEHAETFAKGFEDRVFVDRNVFIFEGLYAQLQDPGEKLLISCISSAAINPKFMFGDEPYVIFTYRLYPDYQKRPIPGNDWIANALINAYEDKSRVMIPNSMHELQQMIRSIHRK